MHTENRISVQVMLFARYLREHEFSADPSIVMLAQKITTQGYLHSPHLLKAGFRSCFCRNREEWQRFDALFDAYWRNTRDGDGLINAKTSGNAASAIAEGQGKLVGLGGTSEKTHHNEDMVGAGDYKALSLADFRFVFDPNQKQHIELLVESMARSARRHFFRKQRIGNKGTRIELGRSLHDSIRTQGQVFNLKYRRQRKRLPKFILLLDISQSMDVYAKLFLRFSRQLMTVFVRSEAFVFNTELTSLGQGFHKLSEDDFEATLNSRSKGWLGGTNIACSLREFNERYLRQCVDHKSTVLIFSDGCDTAKPEELAEQVALIQRRARKLIWVNPLLGRFEPGEKNRYMDPVEPYVDVYLSAHNLNSLKALQNDLLK